MKINRDDIQAMSDDASCPCCRQPVSGALQKHIASSANLALPATEGYRGRITDDELISLSEGAPAYPRAVAERIVASRERYGIAGMQAAEAREAMSLQESADAAVFGELMGNPLAARFAARGRA